MNNAPQVQNPFGAVSMVTENAIGTAEEQRAIQEVQAALVIAKKFPRDQRGAVERIINACTREKLAEGALYSYSRGGTEITGPSIRLAEAMAQMWGNMQFGIRELSSAHGSSTVEAFAWDMETNTRQVKVFQVPHVRYSKSAGNTILKDPRDIYELIANNGARRLRACILGVIPGDVTESAVQQCEVTQALTEEVTPESIKAMLDYFLDTFGVTQQMIEARIQKRADAMNSAQKLNLRRIVQSMKDGMSKPSDWFDTGEVTEKVGPATSTLASQVAATAAAAPAADKPKRARKPKEEPAPAAPLEGTLMDPVVKELADEQEADMAVDAAQPATMSAEDQAAVEDFLGEPDAPEDVVTYAQITDSINKAIAIADLDKLMPVIIKYVGANPVDRAALSGEYSAKKKAIMASTRVQ